VAAQPDGEFHFHRGPAYAAAFLGYDATELEALPADCSRSFAGVGNPHLIAPIDASATVVDIGCGAGMDLLLAAHRVGGTGKAIGVDMTPDMRDRARSAAAAQGLRHVGVIEGDATSLPLPDAILNRAKTGFGVPTAAWMNKASIQLAQARSPAAASKGLTSRRWAQFVLGSLSTHPAWSPSP